MKQKWSLLCSICIIVMMLYGCGPDRITGQPSASVTVTDATGAAVTVAEKPMRIVPLGVSTEDIVLAEVEPDRVAAIGSLPNNMPDASSHIKGRVKAGAESLLSAQPDLVIMPDWISPESIDEIRGMKIPLYVYKTPKTVDEAKAVIHDISTLLNTSGAPLTEAMDRDLEEINRIAGTHTGDMPVVALYTRFGLTGGTGSTFDDMCRYMHVQNGAALAGLGPIDNGTREDLIRVNPDVIIIPSDAYNQDQYTEVDAQQLYSDPALQGVKAVQQRRIYVVDARMLMSYSQFMTKAMLQMARQIYGVQ